MSKSRWALLLLGAIVISLGTLLLLVPRRGGGPAVSPQAEPAPERQPPAAEAPPVQQPTEPVAAAPRAEPRPEPRPPGAGPRIGIVIDDVGYSLGDLEHFLKLPWPLAFAVLPHLPHSEEASRRIAAAGKEQLLHLPMEPANGANPGPGAILTSQSDAEIEALLDGILARFPLAAGVNNHMGSRATADARVMGAVMRSLRERSLFFLDSRTTAASVARAAAGRYAVPLLERDVFVDNENSRAYIEQALERGAGIAEAKGQAVLIGHVQNVELARELERLLPELQGGRGGGSWS